MIRTSGSGGLVALMPPALSLYLDLVRFAAAVGVLLSHLALSPFSERALWWGLGQYGDAAVAVFFVLSGYVIAFVTAERETDGRRYAIGRMSRLLSVALPALAITAVCDALLAAVQPAFYARPEVSGSVGLGLGYLASLLFINEWRVFGLGAVFPGTNSPWWSLSFEATYYLVGGLFLYFRRGWWFLLALLVLVLAGRTVIAMFPLVAARLCAVQPSAGLALFRPNHRRGVLGVVHGAAVAATGGRASAVEQRLVLHALGPWPVQP